MIDKEIIKIIKKMPKLKQRQYDTLKQLVYLQLIGRRLGLYDAVDFIINKLK